MISRFTSTNLLRGAVRYYGSTSTSYTLPDLPYDYKALEPVIAGEIMEIHHKKHHQAYVTNLNASLEKYAAAESAKDVAAMIGLQSAIKFNGGGHVNHSIFWTNLAPKNAQGGVSPSGPLADAINQQFGSLEKFIEKFNAQTVAIQGSGWGWLGYDKANSKLVISSCANQDPLSTIGLTPLLGIDVWEHAYYLQYKNARADYLKNIWQIVNWSNVAERYSKAKRLKHIHDKIAFNLVNLLYSIHWMDNRIE
ncbi:superoxide dismutase [Cavenderia fasciculata]|uniref:Superoxide dismutase n=1 Tax=Cavenderia fasciculata TaxID=261658 RepID=F4QFT0_CACFS|nr:superoxide dismutase [Cavenderia fasciculata]EGG14327.1 superoxide dismutase [Cavenderia fasciculata]|eukprot:XP_004351036.1 superoxide dismutase [Cavenderia fasciculata]